VRPWSAVLYRPTVINCYEGEMPTVGAWWEQWKTFMFDTVGRCKRKSIISAEGTYKCSNSADLSQSELGTNEHNRPSRSACTSNLRPYSTDAAIASSFGAASTKRVCQLLDPIPRSKYPAVTEEEEAGG